MLLASTSPLALGRSMLSLRKKQLALDAETAANCSIACAEAGA
jgi:hypothetical protein